MQSERIWIAILALVCFLAGVAGGVVAALEMDLRPAPNPGPFPAYSASLIEAFELDERQADGLRHVLDRYETDIEELKARQLEDLEPELIKVGLDCRRLIRKWVIPPERWDEFDQLVAGLPVPAKEAAPPQ